MKTKTFRVIRRIAEIVPAALLLSTAVSMAGDTTAETDIFAIARGGQYYDKWWAVIDADKPKGTHPAYTAAGKKKGAATWRCKECHGWDYKGKDGAYGKGSHYSGIIGINGKAGADVKEIAGIIRGAPHNFTKKMLPDKAVQYLAKFVSAGQIDMGKYIDAATKQVKGDKNHGARLFQTVCANCHGFNGKEINFHSADDPEYVGTIANDNPWEFLNKVRHGQPGEVMPALIALQMQDLADITAYAQTLPEK